MPTLENALEQIKDKIRKFGPRAHCTRIIVAEESKKEAIANEPDEEGRRRTMIGFQTYCPEAYSNWHEMINYLVERCAFNPILTIDLVLLLVQEARQHTEGEETDGIDIALASLFKVNGDYEEKLRTAKAEYRARRRKAS